MVGGYATSIEDQLKKASNPAVVKNFHTVYLLNSAVDAPGFAKWRQMVSKYYPDETLSSLNFVAIGGAISLVEALKAAGPDVTRESLIAELDKQQNVDSGVMAGPISFTKEDHVGVK